MRASALALVALALWLSGTTADAVAGDDPPTPPRLVAVGAAAPGLKLQDATGEDRELGALKDEKIALLSFSSVTCPVCKTSADAHVRVFDRFKEKKDTFAFWGLYADAADADALKAYGEQHKLKYPLLIDVDRKVKTAYGIRKTPSLVLVGKDGKVLAVHDGWSDANEKLLTSQIEAALAGDPVPQPARGPGKG